MRYPGLLVTVGVSLALVSCGGGGGDDTGGGGVLPPPPVTTPSISTVRAFSNLTFSQPVALLQAPGDSTRWFVIEKRGVIRVFDNDANATSSQVFLDIRQLVDAQAEGGLLGVAFHPSFPATPDVFVSYTRTSAPMVSYVSRFLSMDGGITLDAGSEAPLFTVEQFDTNHNGGHLAFGPDGFLYVGFGDGGGSGDPQGNGQNTFTLPGAMVRIDVDSASPFTIPPDNPFAGNTLCTQGSGAADCPEIFAWGLRNPWRFSFDTVTGKLWAGDVGQGSWEEVNVIQIGNNYGWNVREGAHCFSPSTGCATTFVDPITEYERGSGGSVTGGFVYRGSAVADLAGWYVFGDFITGQVYAIREDSTQGTIPDEILASGLSIVSFAEDENGELYIVDFGGTLHMVVDAP